MIIGWVLSRWILYRADTNSQKDMMMGCGRSQYDNGVWPRPRLIVHGCINTTHSLWESRNKHGIAAMESNIEASSVHFETQRHDIERRGGEATCQDNSLVPSTTSV